MSFNIRKFDRLLEWDRPAGKKTNDSWLFQVIMLFALITIFGPDTASRSETTASNEVKSASDADTALGSVKELLDLRSISSGESWSTFQASGYDRQEGFYDFGNFLRIEEGRCYVLMDTTGPGCIDRMWFTYKSEPGKEPYDLLIYLDSAEKPVIYVDLDDLFSGKHPPFVSPLAGLCGNKKYPGRYSYVPIAFKSH